jgi:RNA polymerase sigma-70 factor (ECF subfamily)
MMNPMSADPDDIDRLLQQAAGGDSTSWAALLDRYRDHLRRMVAFRLDGRLRGRVDPSDVIQDINLEAWQHLGDYVKRPGTPFVLWLRGIAANKLYELHRHHLGARKRDARREVALDAGARPDATSAALAAQLLGHLTRPSEAAIHAERKVRLQLALGAMDPLDREVLALRHFEHLSPAEVAQVLGIKEKAAAMRYVRALRRLKEILSSLGDSGMGYRP